MRPETHSDDEGPRPAKRVLAGIRTNVRTPQPSVILMAKNKRWIRTQADKRASL